MGCLKNDRPRYWYLRNSKPGSHYAANRVKILSRMASQLAIEKNLYPWRILLRSAKQNAKMKELKFDLTDEWAQSRWTNKCELTGFKFKQSTGHKIHPFSASIDRINSQLGYVQNNSRFILAVVNDIKGTGSDIEMFQRLVEGKTTSSIDIKKIILALF